MNHQLIMLFFGGAIVILIMMVAIFRTSKPKQKHKAEPTAFDHNVMDSDAEKTQRHEPSLVSSAADASINPNADRLASKEQVEEVNSESSESVSPPIESLGSEDELELVENEEEASEQEKWQKTLKAMFKKRIDARNFEKMNIKTPTYLQSSSSVLVVYLMAKRSKLFSGKGLLQAFAKHGFVYSTKHKNFHRLDDNKNILFQVCQAKSPGIFPIETMSESTTDGLSFFLDLDKLIAPKATFQQMLETIYTISKGIGGDLLDDNKSRLTESSVCVYLARIKGVESYRKKEHVK